jgi:hypothetical protein
MMPGHTMTLVAALVPLVLSCAQPADWIADIKAAPQRFWNREVRLEGQVLETRADPPGTTRGFYVLIDDSDSQGILVRSKELPAVGQMQRVRGQIIQDPANAVSLVVVESDRGRIVPAWLLPLIIGSAALAVALLIALINTLGRARSMPTATVDWPGVPSAPAPTTPFRTTAGPAKTQAFRYFGATLQVTEGPDSGREAPIGVSPFLIGRTGGRDNHLPLSDGTVSLTQSQIRYDEALKSFTLVNESQTNKTVLDGKPVDAADLQDGAKIRMGATVITFRRDK